MKKIVLTCLFLACASLPASPALADFYSGTFSTWITDPKEKNIGNAKDITDVGVASDNTSYYFRMVLAAAPAASAAGTVYGIYVGLPDNTGLAPDTADFSLEANLRKRSNVYFNYTLTDWTGGEPVQSTPVFTHSGKTLEWKVDKTLLGSSFSFLGATSTAAGKVVDTTSVAATPIPGSVWLLGSGLVGLIGLRRRNM